MKSNESRTRTRARLDGNSIRRKQDSNHDNLTSVAYSSFFPAVPFIESSRSFPLPTSLRSATWAENTAIEQNKDARKGESRGPKGQIRGLGHSSSQCERCKYRFQKQVKKHWHLRSQILVDNDSFIVVELHVPWQSGVFSIGGL